ncbi:DUF3307 domain-containing protein [Psychrobacillus glaciei]|uniref:DUF3307 domain-containing protein n=1 Tax=Psychrobacillus glaciei TaxID=2283160 RepID=A0A5J6SM04_9BACI|nr:DUF3307 domain-containing protein [Psychrobacillus glaciei]QFF97784.1 DUF3307 domain-containing protein [Psychrobacillus glaciei]
MGVFSYLLIGHLIGDYLLQTNWMARNKSKKWLPLLVHCIVYTVIIIGILYIGNGWLPLNAILLIFVSHLILDKRVFVVWWVKNIMGAKEKDAGWLIIIADQIFHIIVLGAIAHYWYS